MLELRGVGEVASQQKGGMAEREWEGEKRTKQKSFVNKVSRILWSGIPFSLDSEIQAWIPEEEGGKNAPDSLHKNVGWKDPSGRHENESALFVKEILHQ